ncbi:MAG: T9SS type A sorting domain-containing protein, partial [Bacteroidota bacterium]
QTVSGIDPNAQWMWYDPDPNNIAQPFVTGSFPNFPADKSREYYIFRVGPLDSLFSTGQNHYKTWRIEPLPVDTFALIRDQFTSQDRFHLSAVHFISNPVRKIINSPVRTDTFNIIRPDDHLTWYRAEGKAIAVQVEYSNQFEHTKVFLDSVKYFLVPTQKFPHAQPERLDHYTAYRIRNPISFVSRCELQDQFDQHDKASEFIDTLSQVYFLTPTGKNKEPVYDTITHYVAYEIHPKRRTSQTWSSSDQFGSRRLQVLESSHLLVPTKKLSVSPTGVIEESELPTGFALLQSYPNPFNPTTTIEYHVPVEGFIKLSVFDVLGREIAVLVNGNVQAGKHKVTFDASSFAAGVYFYRMQAGKFRESRKLILLK